MFAFFINTSFFQAGLLAESLFRVFDANKSGNLDLFEFVQANSVKNLNTPEDKQGWMFDAFDADGGGTVDGDEITNIVVGLFSKPG
jgi:Ca2+-binding EF-hand superfamily protein